MNVRGQLDKNVTRCLGLLNEANDANFKTTQKSEKNLLLFPYLIMKSSL